MKSLRLVPTGCGLALAAALLAPAERAEGFTTLGFSLGQSQRDFRVFNNFADAGANDNQTPDPNFPGYFGAVMAIWSRALRSTLPAFVRGSEPSVTIRDGTV